MKNLGCCKFLLCVAALLVFLWSYAEESALKSRSVLILRDGWTADGERVIVPHTWNAVDAADGIGRADDWVKNGYSSGALSYERKTVVYRRELPDPTPMRRYFLRFPGASIRAEVKVNGVAVGSHTGAFTAFCFEITKALKSNGNILEVAVNNDFDPDVQPIHADFSVYGGLYRIPELVETPMVCIDPVTDAAKGVRIEADAATGKVTAYVSVLGGTNEVQRFHFPQPKLWSPETPNLYTVKVVVRQQGCEDSLDVRFGFRTVEFRGDGFYLNGKKRKLRGVCRHQDRAGKGWGRSREDEADDIRWIKLMGADAVRTSHYPQSEAFYDLCDEHGLLVWTEVPNVNGLTFTETARENELREAREMVAQNRNHPCIFVWGIFNELYNMPMAQAPESRMRALKEYVRSLDSSRSVVAASCHVKRKELNAIPEQMGFNLYPGWYGKAADKMDEAIDDAFAQNPDRPIAAVSEYGCGGCVEQHADAKFRMPRTDSAFHPEEYQAYLHWGNYRGIVGDARIWGSFVWVMFDLGSDARREGAVFGMNDKGMVTWDRMTAKDAFYFYKANWNPESELHLVGSRMTETKNAKATVMAFSNVGKVSLYLNGKFYGELAPDEVNTAMWNEVPLEIGVNEIEVRAGSLRKCARWTRRLDEFPKIGKPRRLTDGPKDHLLASYTGINSWSADNRYLLVLETDVNGRLSAAGEACTIGVVDTRDENRFIPFAETRAWNFQEAAMAHWLPWAKDTVVFNDFRDGKFVAVVMNWRTKEVLRVIPHPVSAVSADGRKAISLNYARIRLTRPDYGYAGPGQDPLTGEAYPENDGLFLVDLMTGKAKLIVSIASVRSQMPPVGPKGLAYFCHTVFSKDGKRVFWLSRGIDWYDPIAEKASSWTTSAFTCNVDGTQVRRCFPDNWGGSHFNWLDDKTMAVTVYPKDHARGAWHVRFTVGEEEKVKRLAPGILDWDGHCVWSPNGKWISTEGYFDKTFHRHWALMRTADEAVIPVGSFFVPEAYRGGFWRCDLHGRWRPDGKQIGFNSVHEGSRQVYVMDVEEDL